MTEQLTQEQIERGHRVHAIVNSLWEAKDGTEVYLAFMHIPSENLRILRDMFEVIINDRKEQENENN